ncbi:hypothetical protein PR048_003138 [Dryococelus australis]|uniref:Uncharacterized protein n=1 Tax=Dryococelus australis TaxID=614101 RepID=A0ABQ9IPG5_9NEOP|nr:hypothetical protein PR048_003138 [Dryococelus australis]
MALASPTLPPGGSDVSIVGGKLQVCRSVVNIPVGNPGCGAYPSTPLGIDDFLQTHPLNPLDGKKRGAAMIRTGFDYRRHNPRFSHVGNRCRTMPLVGGFSRGSPVSSVHAFRCCSIPISIHPIRLSRPRQQAVCYRGLRRVFRLHHKATQGAEPDVSVYRHNSGHNDLNFTGQCTTRRRQQKRYEVVANQKSIQPLNRIRLERASQKQSSDTHKTPYDRVKRCLERKINIKASERVNVDVFAQNERPLAVHSALSNSPLRMNCLSSKGICSSSGALFLPPPTFAQLSELSQHFDERWRTLTYLMQPMVFPTYLIVGNEPCITSETTVKDRIGASRKSEVLITDDGDYGSSTGMKGRGKRGVPRENPPTSGIVRHDFHLRKSGSDPAGD